MQTSGPFVVSVFALPGNLEPGTSEFGVMVQDRDTLESLLDAQVDVQATSVSRSAVPVRASSDDSENKLLQNADVDLPAEGEWDLRVNVQRDGTKRCGEFAAARS